MADTLLDISIPNTEYIDVNTLTSIPVGTAVGLTNKGHTWVSIVICPTQPATDSLDGDVLCNLPNPTATRYIASGRNTIWAKAIGESSSKLTIQTNPEALSPDSSYEDGRRFRTYLDFTDVTLPVVLKFEINEEIDLTLSVQDIHDGALKYSVYSGGIEGGSFSNIVPAYRMNNKAGVPVRPSGVTLTYGGTLDTSGVTPSDVTYIRSSGASGQTATVSGESSGKRGFPVTTAYVVLEQIAGSNKPPKGVVRYEWTVK